MLADNEHESAMSRTTPGVLQDHLRRRRAFDLEGDLAANYAEDVVVISMDGVFHGHDGVRRTASILRELLPNAEYVYDLLCHHGEVALLSWSARAQNEASVCHGADTFLVRNGRIAAQTIHYFVKRAG